ncbi:hypothetical protein [Oceanobacillus sp. CAU 1775]
MKKKIYASIGVIVLLVVFYNGYNYYNGPKIVDGVISKEISNTGDPGTVASEFSPEDTVFFTAKSNRFWVKEAKVIWYKDNLSSKNRFLVEENVIKNDAGYFNVQLTAPDKLEEGEYFVTIYEEGNDIIETKGKFIVKN